MKLSPLLVPATRATVTTVATLPSRIDITRGLTGHLATRNTSSQVNASSTAHSVSRSVKNSTSTKLTSAISDYVSPDTDLLNAAAQTWNEHKEYKHAYFDLGGNNCNNSINARTAGWYPKWIKQAMIDYPEEHEAVGQNEHRLFARIDWNGQDFRCGIYDQGCDAAPSCEIIVKHTIKHNSNFLRAVPNYCLIFLLLTIFRLQ